VNSLALQDLGCQEQVLIRRIGTATDGYLVYKQRPDLPDWFHRIGAVRAGCQRLQLAQVEGDLLIVNSARISLKRSPAFSPPLGGEKAACLFVAREIEAVAPSSAPY